MIDIWVDEKYGEEFKKIIHHYLDKREDIIKSTDITYHEILTDE